MVSGARDGTVVSWDPNSCQEIKKEEIPRNIVSIMIMKIVVKELQMFMIIKVP